MRSKDTCSKEYTGLRIEAHFLSTRVADPSVRCGVVCEIVHLSVVPSSPIAQIENQAIKLMNAWFRVMIKTEITAALLGCNPVVLTLCRVSQSSHGKDDSSGN
jgi:hypothetical protein